MVILSRKSIDFYSAGTRTVGHPVLSLHDTMDAVVWLHLLAQHGDIRICEKGCIQSIGSFPVSNL